MRKIVVTCLVLAGTVPAAHATVTTSAAIQRSSIVSLSDPETGAQSASSSMSYNGGGTSGCRCGLSSSSSADAASGNLLVNTSAVGGYGGDTGTATASARITADILFSALDATKMSTVIFTLADLTSAANAFMPNQSLVMNLTGSFGTQSFTQLGTATHDYVFSFTGPAQVHLDLLLQGGSRYGALNSDYLNSAATIAMRTTNAGVSSNGFLTSPVPEPASWAMMIGGFGLVGAAIRRRKVATTVSA